MEGLGNVNLEDNSLDVSEGNEEQQKDQGGQANERETSTPNKPSDDSATASNGSVPNEKRSKDAKGDVSADDDKEPTSKPVSDKHKIKIYGEEKEVTLEELKKLAQKTAGSDKAFQEAAQLKKDVSAFINELKNNPAKVFKELGVNFKDVAESHLMKELDLESMSEAERKNLEYEEQLSRYKQQEEARKKYEEEQRRHQETQKYREHYEKVVTDALEGSGLPNTPASIKRITQYMSHIISKTQNPEFTPTLMSQIVNKVKSDIITEQKQLYGALDADKLAELLGDDVSKKINKHYLNKLQNKNNRQAPKNSGNINTARDSNKLSKDEWRERLNKIMRGE